MSSPRRNLLILLLVSFVLRVIWASALETGQDEAYHWLYSVYPDWSYFDHPPMLMYVTKCGIALMGGWVHPLSIRLGFILMFAASTVVMFVWTARWYGESAGFYAALALNLSAYYTAAAGAFVLPDGPLLFFSLLTMWRLGEALVGSPGKTWPWMLVGLACAGAMLSKYHAVFLPLGALAYILVTPSARFQLRTPGPYLAAAVGFLGLLPVLIWNMQHDWASFGFQSARAVGATFQIRGLAVMIFGPMALLLPWIWVPLVGILFGRTLSFGSSKGIDRLLICQALVPLGLFTAVSCTRMILPHWPLIGFLPLYPLLGLSWAVRVRAEPVVVQRWLNFMVGFLVVVASGFAIQARYGFIRFPFKDPCTEISGWKSVATELKQRRLLDEPDSFIFTNHWFDSGQIAFAIRNRVPVTCYREGDARGFAHWSRPDDYVGKSGLLLDPQNQIGLDSIYKPYFREIKELSPIEMTRSGRPLRTVRVYQCLDQLRPFPFAYERKSK